MSPLWHGLPFGLIKVKEVHDQNAVYINTREWHVRWKSFIVQQASDVIFTAVIAEAKLPPPFSAEWLFDRVQSELTMPQNPPQRMLLFHYRKQIIFSQCFEYGGFLLFWSTFNDMWPYSSMAKASWQIHRIPIMLSAIIHQVWFHRNALIMWPNYLKDAMDIIKSLWLLWSATKAIWPRYACQIPTNCGSQRDLSLMKSDLQMKRAWLEVTGRGMHR